MTHHLRAAIVPWLIAPAAFVVGVERGPRWFPASSPATDPVVVLHIAIPNRVPDTFEQRHDLRITPVDALLQLRCELARAYHQGPTQEFPYQYRDGELAIAIAKIQAELERRGVAMAGVAAGSDDGR